MREAHEPLSSLAEDLLSFRDLSRLQRQPVPQVAMHLDFRGGDTALTITVNGADVVEIHSSDLDIATRKAKEDFEKWSNAGLGR